MGNRRRLMTGRRSAWRFAWAVAVLSMPSAAAAANLCPWLNEATASGLLGANAVGAYSEAAGGQPAVCTFTAAQERGERTLKIEVETAANAHERLEDVLKSCGSGASLVKAIGNEAQRCEGSGGKGSTSEFLAGRVRDQVFSITLGTTLRKDPVLSEEMMRAEIVTAAEQVSGNLF